jgi:hypothetical protein
VNAPGSFLLHTFLVRDARINGTFRTNFTRLCRALTLSGRADENDEPVLQDPHIETVPRTSSSPQAARIRYGIFENRTVRGIAGGIRGGGRHPRRHLHRSLSSQKSDRKGNNQEPTSGRTLRNRFSAVFRGTTTRCSTTAASGTFHGRHPRRSRRSSPRVCVHLIGSACFVSEDKDHIL